jgi:hexosaminidase
LSGEDAIHGDEGYKLNITKKMVSLTSSSLEGIFRGIQTIRQILPADIELPAKQEGPWEIATGIITDYPDYSYRGAMLDVSRHFFGVDDVKRFIDFLAYYKMNVLHLHLSDDQGWRIEIKSWPDLATHGGSTQVGGEAGGYYTQEQYSDIVQYAGERYITIVPEIDMPGHTNAALSSYAELNCDGKATELYTGTRVGFSTLCTDKEITYKFIDDVVRELAALTPGPYIHIGGDESNATKEEDYIPFINRVQDIVLAHGKKVIGWDDIAIASLKPNAFAQHWSNVKNANMAVSQGAKLIMSPAKKAYLDMKYDRSTKLGLRWAGLIEIDTGYIWDPADYVPGIGKENILGIEAPLWTETITNMDEIEFMVFPRLPGYAEIGWTPSSLRNWDEYKERLAKHGERFKAMDIDFYRSELVPWAGATQ